MDSEETDIKLNTKHIAAIAGFCARPSRNALHCIHFGRPFMWDGGHFGGALMPMRIPTLLADAPKELTNVA